jgi:hypothetical protein
LEIKLAADAYFEGRNEKKRGKKKKSRIIKIIASDNDA